MWPRKVLAVLISLYCLLQLPKALEDTQHRVSALEAAQSKSAAALAAQLESTTTLLSTLVSNGLNSHAQE